MPVSLHIIIYIVLSVWVSVVCCKYSNSRKQKTKEVSYVWHESVALQTYWCYTDMVAQINDMTNQKNTTDSDWDEILPLLDYFDEWREWVSPNRTETSLRKFALESRKTP